MLRIFTVTLFCCISLLVTTIAFAQEAQAVQQSLLPEIDPQDIEIRSQFQARFPGLRRQPILGFNPRPRVFQIDPNRQPFIEDEETVMANLPIGQLDRPQAPVYQPLGYADPQNGFARIGVGSYITPEADVYAITKLDSRNWVSANLNYFSTDGHLDEFTSSSRNVDLSINSYSAFTKRLKLATNLGVRSNFNHFPGLVTENGEPQNVRNRVSGEGFGGGAELTFAQTSLSGFSLSVDGYANQFELDSALDNYGGSLNEWGVSGKAEYSRLGENIQEVHRLRLTSSTGGIQTFGNSAQSWSVSQLSAHYERLFDYKTDIKASLGVAGVSDAVEDYTFYVTPSITAVHTLFDGLDVRAKFSGTPSHRSLAGIQSENRFIDLSVPVQHQFEWMALAEVILEPFSGTWIVGGVSYQNIRNHLYYNRNENAIAGTGFTEGFYQATFNRANIPRLYGAFSQDLRPDVLWVRADGYLQRPRLSGNEKIPFVESVGIKGTVSFRPVRQLIVEGWGEFVGGRKDSFDNDLSSFILLGGRFEFSVNERLGVYGKLLNLTGEEYELWQGVPERGFQAFVGVTYLF
jgi:hypothetical protein